MATNLVQNIDTSVTLATAVAGCADPTKWTLVESKVLDNGGRESLFQRNDADQGYPDTVRIGSYPNGKSGADAGYNTSIRRDYWNKYTDDDSDIHYEANVFTMAFQTKRVPLIGSTEGLPALIFNTLTIALAGNISTGTPDWDGMDRLSRGITDVDVEDLTVS